MDYTVKHFEILVDVFHIELNCTIWSLHDLHSIFHKLIVILILIFIHSDSHI